MVAEVLLARRRRLRPRRLRRRAQQAKGHVVDDGQGRARGEPGQLLEDGAGIAQMVPTAQDQHMVDTLEVADGLGVADAQLGPGTAGPQRLQFL